MKEDRGPGPSGPLFDFLRESFSEIGVGKQIQYYYTLLDYNIKSGEELARSDIYITEIREEEVERLKKRARLYMDELYEYLGYKFGGNINMNIMRLRLRLHEMGIDHVEALISSHRNNEIVDELTDLSHAPLIPEYPTRGGAPKYIKEERRPNIGPPSQYPPEYAETIPVNINPHDIPGRSRGSVGSRESRPQTYNLHTPISPTLSDPPPTSIQIHLEHSRTAPMIDQRAPLIDHRAAPLIDQRAPLIDHRAAPLIDQRAPLIDHRAAPLIDQRTAPLIDHRAAPLIDQRAAPLIDQRAPLIDHRAAPLIDNRAAPLIDNRGPMIDHRGAMIEQRPINAPWGPIMRQAAPAPRLAPRPVGATATGRSGEMGYMEPPNINMRAMNPAEYHMSKRDNQEYIPPDYISGQPIHNIERNIIEERKVGGNREGMKGEYKNVGSSNSSNSPPHPFPPYEGRVALPLAGETVAGVIGVIGDRGFTGDRGVIGDRGFTGDRGVIGDRGFTGDRGVMGDRGFTGDRGDNIHILSQYAYGAPKKLKGRFKSRGLIWVDKNIINTENDSHWEDLTEIKTYFQTVHKLSERPQSIQILKDSHSQKVQWVIITNGYQADKYIRQIKDMNYVLDILIFTQENRGDISLLGDKKVRGRIVFDIDALIMELKHIVLE